MDNVSNIIKEIKAGNVKPIYFLMGDEPYYIDKIAEFIENNVLPEESRGFDQTVLYGKDVSIQDVVGAAKRFPMLGEKQVIIVREAQELSRNINELTAYVENPQPTTILVFCYKRDKLDGKLKVTKALTKQNYIFHSKKKYENEVLKWMTGVLKTKKLTIEPKAAALFIEFLGTDLTRISNEFDKLAILLKPGDVITVDIIEQNIGFSKDYNNFELISAISTLNVQKSYRIINQFSKDPSANPVLLTISALYTHFKRILTYHALPNKSNAASVLKMSPYFVGEIEQAAKLFPMKNTAKIISALHRLDVKSKGVDAGNISHNDLLKETLISIFENVKK
ncbi:DNA polymerase III subunit delta [Flavobacterium agricola]|uniref:DNA polymerase III subunit delta n=1 Tax=Flavobacterium agricola TaxID=2870839 RepID=A0ABY6M458_9FLAO|nr:DNA polymerase III subunit delta [Flavobacterium agricola]UYW02338.1 DNA polymerase III subunit delta [Flavobacterium agricola]